MRQSLLDEALTILSDGTRRHILISLLEHNPQDVDDLHRRPEAAMDPDGLERLAVQLHHTHLPKLEAAELIERNEEAGTVTRGPRFEEIEPLVELVDEYREGLSDDRLR